MVYFKVFKSNRREIVTFVTDNINDIFLAQKEIEEKVKDGYNKSGPFKFSDDSKINKWSIIYEIK